MRSSGHHSARQTVIHAIVGVSVGLFSMLGFENFPANSVVQAQSVATSAASSSSVSLKPSMFGANVSGWDPWMLSPSGVSAIQSMGFGVQQFPNCPWVYNWSTNDSLNNGKWYPIPVSLNQWATELEQTHNTGLYIVPYGFNRSGTGGATVGTVQRLTEYIVQNHLPISALVIGSEQYGSWAQNLHSQQTALRYAQLSAQMAQAIHAIDPNMKVGVDYDLPANVTQPDVASTQWNKTVISVAGPYVQFVSAHIYPLEQVQGNVSLLQSLHMQLALDMNFITQQINEFGGSNANHLAVWVTEFNPYGLESAQSVRPVFGAALVQSYLQMMSMGAKQVDWWAMYGDAHVPQPLGSVAENTPLATGVNVPFASNGLASEAIAPQPQPENSLYPTGTAYAMMMQLIGKGASLHIDSALYEKYHVFAALIQHNTVGDWIVINDSHQLATVNVSGQQQAIPSTGMAVFKNVPILELPSVSGTGTASELVQTSNSVGVSSLPIVTGIGQHQETSISSATWNPNTDMLSIYGTDLSINPSEEVAAPGQGIDQPNLMFTDSTSKANYGWSYKNVNTDWYGITPEIWTNSVITAKLDGPLPQIGDTLQISWWTPIGYIDVPTAVVPVRWLNPQSTVDIKGSITSASYSPATYTLTIEGQNLGTAPITTPAGGGGINQAEMGVLILGSNIQYGYAGNGDWYGIQIKEWTPTQIVVVLNTPPALGQPVEVQWMGTGQTIVASS